jgi:cell division protein FtsL
MKGNMNRDEPEFNFAWKLAIVFLCIFIVATTFKDYDQSEEIKNLKHRIELMEKKNDTSK